MKEKVILGLSGGVDSAVSATLLKNAGYDVIGVFLDAKLASSEDARKVALDAGIEFICHDFYETLEENVCKYFVDSYLNGLTPNPCIMCNPTSKFKTLCDYAEKFGAKYVATGHYLKTDVRTFNEITQKVIVKSDSNKDQSYMLCRLSQDVIEKVIFPLENFTSKDDVRAKASEFGIHVAKKPDSMEVCFVPKNHTDYIESRGHILPKGNFVDIHGKVLGKHDGIHKYTVGQRKGLGISAKTKLFVSEINTKTNEVILSSEDVFCTEINVSDISFCIQSFKGLTFEANVKVRYSSRESSATVISLSDTTAKIVFTEPVRAPAPGQSAVFYIDNALIGGGIIL